MAAIPNTGGMAYGARRPKRPRRRTQLVAGKVKVGPVRGRGFTSVGGRGTSAAAPKAPPPPAKVPLPEAPTITAGPPPELPQSAADRNTARENYGIGVGSINDRMRSLGLAYGGVNSVQQYDPNNDAAISQFGLSPLDVNDPNNTSALAAIQRGWLGASKATGESANAANTFFSSRQLNDQAELVNDANRQRDKALSDYQQAVSDLYRELLGYRSTRDEAFRNADAADIIAAAQQDPEAEAMNLPPSAADQAAGRSPDRSPAPAQRAGGRDSYQFTNVARRRARRRPVRRGTGGR